MSNDATGIDIPLDTAFNPSELTDVIPPESHVDTGIRLKRIRDAFGFSQRELAKRSGVTNSSISMIEQGQVSPSIQSLSRILASFPISLSDFFGFNLALGASAQTGGELGNQSFSVPPAHQLDGRIEHLLAGQTTALTTLAVDSCGVVLDGKVQLTLLTGNRFLTSGDSFYIPANQLFRLINLSQHDTSLFRCSLFVHKGL